MQKVSTRAAAAQQRDRWVRRHALAAGGLGMAHLGWLLFGGFGNWLVAIMFFLLEAWGLAQFGLRAMLGWSSPPPTTRSSATVEVPVDIIITCTFHSPDELERTLIASQSVRQIRRTIVTLQRDLPELRAAVDRFDVELVIAPGNHVDGFWAGAQHSRFALWLEAGQVPMPECAEVLAPTFADPRVAYVQANLGLLNTDSFAHLRGGRDEDAFRSRVVQPGLGERGSASWRGGGSMVRVLAVATSGGFDRGDQAALQRSMVRLQTGGWHGRHHNGAEVVHAAAPDSLGSYLMVRRRSAIELLRVFTTPENPLRQPGLTRRQRLDHLALAAGFAGSIRQFALTLLLIVMLATGAVPYAGTGVVWAALWVPLQLLLIRTNRLLARGTMERGDWTRQAWRTLAADLNAFATVLGLQRRVVAFHTSTGSGLGALAKLRLPAVTLVALDVALVARSLTLVWPRLLPRFSLTGRLIALGLGLVVVVVLVDVLQMAVRRKQRRASFRLTTDLPAVIEGHPVRVIDLAVKGLGSQLDSRTSPFVLDQTVSVSLRLPSHAGDGATWTLEGVVRSLVDRGDTQRIGIQFLDLPTATRTALISYCAVDHHANAEADDTLEVDPSRFDVPAARGRGTRLLSAAAMLLGAIVFLAGPAAPAALADVVTTTSVCLHTSTGAPIAGASAGFHYDDEWHSIGSTGPDGCVAGQMPGEKTKVELIHQDIRQVVRQHLGRNPVVEFRTVPVRIELTDTAGAGIPSGVVQFRSAGTWKPIGETGADGRLTTELLGSRRPFSMTLDGVRVEKTVDVREVANVPFSTVPFDVTLHDASGAPVAGAAVEYRGDDWVGLGSTNESGTLSGELLPGRVRFAVQTAGGRTTIRQPLAEEPTVAFRTEAVNVTFTDSTGTPIPEALIELQDAGGRAWVELGRTDEAGLLTTELLPQTRSFRMTHGGRRARVRQDIAADPVVRFATVPAAVAVHAVDGTPIAGVDVEVHGSGWTSLGETDADGRLVAELLPLQTRYRLTLDGIRSQFRHDLTVDPELRVDTVEAVVRLADAGGAPLIGSQVDIKTGRWTLMGHTDERGEVRREVLPTSVSVRVLHEGLRKFVRSDVSDGSPIEVRTVPVVADESTAVVEYRAGSWRPFSDGIEVLPVRLQVRLSDGSRHTVDLAEGLENLVPSGLTRPLPAGANVEPEQLDENEQLDDAAPEEPAASSTTTTTPSDATSPSTLVPAADDDRGLSNSQIDDDAEPDAVTSTTTPAATESTVVSTTTSSSTPADGASSTTSAAPTDDSTSQTTVATTTTTTAPEATTTTSPDPVATNDPDDSATVTTEAASPDPDVTTTTSTTVDATTDELTAATTAAPAPSTSTVAPSTTTTTTSAVPSTTTTAAPEPTTSTPVDDGGAVEQPDEPDDAADPEIVQAIAAGVVLAEPGAAFEPETMATSFGWSSPDPVTTEVLAVSLEDAAVYTQAGTETTVGYEFLIDNTSDRDLGHGSVVELHIPGAMELSPESQEEWDCTADDTTWRCRRIGPFLADSSSTIRVAAAVRTPEVLAFEPGDRMEDFGILAGAAVVLFGVLYGGMSVAGRSRD